MADPWYPAANAVVSQIKITEIDRTNEAVKVDLLPGGGNVRVLGTPGQLVKNKFVKTMNLPKDFTLEFDLTLKGVVRQWASVFHFTTGNDCCAHGSRIPAMWFRPGSKTFIVVDGTQSNGNAHNNHGSLTIGKKVSIKMKATRNSFDTYIDGKKTGSINRSGKDRKAWKNVKVCTFGFHSDRSSFAEGMRAGVL
jgi:hypothetical protein